MNTDRHRICNLIKREIEVQEEEYYKCYINAVQNGVAHA